MLFLLHFLLAKDIVHDLNQKYGWDVETSSLELEKNLVRFGEYNLKIVNFYHKKFKFTYNFSVKVTVMPQKLISKLMKSPQDKKGSK